MSPLNAPFAQVAKFPRGALCAVTSSWDDNSSSNMDMKAILDSMNLKGTFYIDMGSPRSDALTESQMKTLAAAHELGSHTWSHVNAKTCDPKTLRKELLESKEYLENIAGRAVLGMAYPWGEYSSKSAKIVRECGYLFARTTKEGITSFPPVDSYGWGVSIYAKGATTSTERIRSKEVLAPGLLLSGKAILYVRYRTSDWRQLARRLFERARQVKGVWHIYGHASDFSEAKPETKREFVEISKQVALMDDVWYATNGMLFLNEIVKKAVSITSSRSGSEYVFRIQANISRSVTETTPIPLTLCVPKEWREKFGVIVSTTGTGKFEMKRVRNLVSIDIFDSQATLTVKAV